MAITHLIQMKLYIVDQETEASKLRWLGWTESQIHQFGVGVGIWVLVCKDPRSSCCCPVDTELRTECAASVNTHPTPSSALTTQRPLGVIVRPEFCFSTCTIQGCYWKGHTRQQKWLAIHFYPQMAQISSLKNTDSKQVWYTQLLSHSTEQAEAEELWVQGQPGL